MNSVNNIEYAVCECNNAWAGAYCTERVNECEGNPCYENVECTLPPEPATGYLCGPCPDGLQGDGVKCFGKNNQPSCSFVNLIILNYVNV